jgi:hypothetical protein
LALNLDAQALQVPLKHTGANVGVVELSFFDKSVQVIITNVTVLLEWNAQLV